MPGVQTLQGLPAIEQKMIEAPADDVDFDERGSD
jgi:hypothetical protein